MSLNNNLKASISSPLPEGTTSCWLGYYCLVFSLGVSFSIAGLANSADSGVLDSQSGAANFIRPFFDVMDCNSEGAIDSSEVDDHFHQIFFSLDRDRSRSITLPELILLSKDRGKSEALFKRVDSNADNVLSAREYRNHLVSAIKRADLNGDGELSRVEVGLPPAQVRPAAKMKVLPGYQFRTFNRSVAQ